MLYGLTETVITQRAIFFLQMTAETMLRPWFLEELLSQARKYAWRKRGPPCSCSLCLQQGRAHIPLCKYPYTSCGLMEHPEARVGWMQKCFSLSGHLGYIWWEKSKLLHKWLSSEKYCTAHYTPIFSIKVHVGWILIFFVVVSFFFFPLVDRSLAFKPELRPC